MSRYGFHPVERVDRRAAAGFGAGLVSAAASALATWAYLSSIKLDDGLEVFVFFPILTVAVALASGIVVWGAERGTVVTVTMAVGAGALLGSCLATVAAGAPGAIFAVVLFGTQWIAAGCFAGCGITAATHSIVRRARR